jgi:hypothetical protein
MRRVSVFVLLGPALAWLTAGVLLTPELFARPSLGALGFYAFALVPFYCLGALPLLALAGADELMARYRTHRIARAVLCGCIGAGAVLLIFYPLARHFGAQQDFADNVFRLALLGGIPPAVCCWRAGAGEAANTVQQ